MNENLRNVYIQIMYKVVCDNTYSISIAIYIYKTTLFISHSLVIQLNHGDELFCRSRMDGNAAIEIGFSSTHLNGNAETLQNFSR